MKRKRAVVASVVGAGVLAVGGGLGWALTSSFEIPPFPERAVTLVPDGAYEVSWVSREWGTVRSSATVEGVAYFQDGQCAQDVVVQETFYASDAPPVDPDVEALLGELENPPAYRVVQDLGERAVFDVEGQGWVQYGTFVPPGPYLTLGAPELGVADGSRPGEAGVCAVLISEAVLDRAGEGRFAVDPQRVAAYWDAAARTYFYDVASQSGLPGKFRDRAAADLAAMSVPLTLEAAVGGVGVTRQVGQDGTITVTWAPTREAEDLTLPGSTLVLRPVETVSISVPEPDVTWQQGLREGDQSGAGS